MKKVDGKDVERILSRYIHVDEELIKKIQTSEETDDIRRALFDAVIQGVDVSFALMYDWVIEELANKVLSMSGKKRKEKVKSEVEVERIKGLPAGYRTKLGLAYNRKEELMIERMKKMGFSGEEAWERFDKSFEGRTKESVMLKFKRV